MFLTTFFPLRALTDFPKPSPSKAVLKAPKPTGAKLSALPDLISSSKDIPKLSAFCSLYVI